ncbi:MULTISPECIES: AlpA family transcriptional regulator [unclassified Shewanella]|uniref:AlpA family transcriptional regulator n=1 Tax=unclassified Shewanella TaxID=196818 RepID=UPI000C83C3AB|nr:MULTISPECIES: AlpA family transcriptional regulator [unclassified Shewanella]MDO6679389.1 hypothetical protein [Shewanella sp. 4_MG-2023]
MTKYLSYSDLETRYNRSSKSIWRWWKVDKRFPAPTRINGVLLGWTIEQVEAFEQGQFS